MRSWEKPGFTFSINWPPGFTPTIKPTRDLIRTALAVRNREARLANGDTGTIAGGLSGRAPALQGKAYIERQRALAAASKRK